MTQLDTIVLGLGHRARHGKDTVAAMIKANRGDKYNIEICPFAKALKYEVNQAALSAGGMKELFRPDYYFYRADGSFVSLPEWVTYDENPPMDDPLCPLGKQRTLLQWWGTEFRRAVDPNYWVNKTGQYIATAKPDVAIIPDMRFPNEMDFVERHGATIKVVRPGIASPNSHPSEEALAHIPDVYWYEVIINNGTLEDLQEKSLAVFDKIMAFFKQERGAGDFGVKEGRE